MKKLLSFLFLLCSFSSIAQLKISEMPTYAGNPAGGFVPIVIGGVNRKIDATLFGYSFTNSPAYGVTNTLISHWNTAYDRSLTAGAFSTDTLTLTKQDGTTIKVSLAGRYLKLSDTASMLSPYATIIQNALKLNISDTASMLSHYLLSNVAAGTYSTIVQNALKVNISDTAAMLLPYVLKGGSTMTGYLTSLVILLMQITLLIKTMLTILLPG
jgi:hypothetical protein